MAIQEKFSTARNEGPPAAEAPPPGLEIDQDIASARRAVKFQHGAWGVMLLIAVAGMLGLFGPGLLGDKTAASPDGRLRVEYARFGRYQAENNDLRLHVAPGVGKGGLVRVWVDRDFLSSLEKTDITPQPERVEAAGARYTYVFHAPDNAQPVDVVLRTQPEKIGPLSGRFGLDDGASVEVRQFFWP